MKKSILSYEKKALTVIFCIVSLFLHCSCSDTISADKSPELCQEDDDKTSLRATRAAFDNYFDWDRVNSITVQTPFGETTALTIPWRKEAADQLGIPSEWIDPDAFASATNQRYYSRENGWELVYSNVMDHTFNKYFALYHKPTGLLRFFYYALFGDSDGGNTSSFWGIKMDRSSSLFNFMHPFANALDKPLHSPSYICSSPGLIVTKDSMFMGTGYQVNNWYGFEIECAYDNRINQQSGHLFEFKAWAANVSRITGSSLANGDIAGTIEYLSNNQSFSVNLNNMFNNTGSDKFFNINRNDGIIDGLGDKIQEGINKNDPFFEGLWGNIKKNASVGIGDGAKAGLSAILSSGGSVAAKALKGAVSSVLGIGGNQPSIGKISLPLSANMQYDLINSHYLPGYGDISQLPVPGSTSNPNAMPIYNKPLGAWNLKRTPQVFIEGITHNFYLFDGLFNYNFYKGVQQFRYFLDCDPGDILLNEEIRNKVSIRNFRTMLAYAQTSGSLLDLTGKSDMSHVGCPIPSAFLQNSKYYSSDDFWGFKELTEYPAVFGTIRRLNSHSWGDTIEPIPHYHGDMKAIVSFDLVDNSTGKVYSISKWFNVDFAQQKMNYKEIKINNQYLYDAYVETLKTDPMFPSLDYNYQVITDRDFIK